MARFGRAHGCAGLVLALSLMFGGCAASSRAASSRILTDGDARTLRASEGMVVITGVANFPGRAFIRRLDGTVAPIPAERGSVAARFRVGEPDERASADLYLEQGKDNFVIMAMPSGRYHWSEVYDSKAGKVARLGKRYIFDVKAGVINYIGDPQFAGNWNNNTCELRFADNGDATYSYLREKYPQFSAAYQFEKNMTKDLADHSRDPDPSLEEDEPRPPPPSARAIIGKVLTDTRAFRDEMCACQDRACVARVSKAMARWSEEFGLDANSPKPTASEQAELAELKRAITACAANGTSSAAPQPGNSSTAPHMGPHVSSRASAG